MSALPDQRFSRAMSVIAEGNSAVQPNTSGPPLSRMAFLAPASPANNSGMANGCCSWILLLFVRVGFWFNS
jgi:hypothetical protein